MARRTIPLTTIREKCRRLADHLVSTGGASREALRVLEPGERDNPDPGPEGVLAWYGFLHQQLARDELRLAGSREPDEKVAADAEAMAALAGRPEVVPLTNPVGDVRAVEVHPKSLEALSFIEARDVLHQKLNALRERLARDDGADSLVLLERIDAERVAQLRTLVWSVCHPGPGLPWPVTSQPDPPAWTDLHPYDLVRILAAHRKVNGARLQALSRLCAPGEGGGKAPTWSVFVGAAAESLGIQPSVLLRDWSLGEVLSTFRLASEAKRAAHDVAKVKRAA